MNTSTDLHIPAALNIFWGLTIGVVAAGLLPLGRVSEFVLNLTRRGKLKLATTSENSPVRFFLIDSWSFLAHLRLLLLPKKYPLVRWKAKLPFRAPTFVVALFRRLRCLIPCLGISSEDLIWTASLSHHLPMLWLLLDKWAVFFKSEFVVVRNT